jgi:hypothetical protein
MLADPATTRMMKTVTRLRREPRTDLRAALLELAGGKGELLRHSERAWASITFSGARHRVVMAFSGVEAVAAGERYIALLPDHEFTVPGQLVADAAVLSAVHEMLPEPRLTVDAELLLLEDC